MAKQMIFLFFILGGMNAFATDGYIKIELDHVITSLTINKSVLELLDKETRRSLTPIVKGGWYKDLSQSVQFTIALMDVDKNGKFNDIGIDQIIIGDFGSDSLYTHSSVSCNVIDPVSYIYSNDHYYKLSDIQPDGEYLTLEDCSYCRDSKDIVPTIRLFNLIPDAEFKLLNGSSSNFRNYIKQGKYIYIEIWGTWCGPCLKSMPDLSNAYEKLKDQLLIISLNYNDRTGDVNEFIKNYKMNWVNGVSTNKLNFELMANGYPYGILFDQDGKIVKAFVHPSDLIKLVTR